MDNTSNAIVNRDGNAMVKTSQAETYNPSAYNTGCMFDFCSKRLSVMRSG